MQGSCRAAAAGGHDVDQTEFRRILGHYPTGVCVVTALVDGGPIGLTIGSFTSVSLDPPLVGFLPARSSKTWPRIKAAGQFCANVLADNQSALPGRFASPTADRFADTDTRNQTWPASSRRHCRVAGLQTLRCLGGRRPFVHPWPSGLDACRPRPSPLIVFPRAIRRFRAYRGRMTCR